MTFDAVGPCFTVTAEIQNAVHLIVKAVTNKMSLALTFSVLSCPNVRTTAMSPLHLLPLVINASILIPPPVISCGGVHLMNSCDKSPILCALRQRITLTMNSLTRHFLSFLQTSVEPSSSTKNPALLRNTVSPMLHTKEWMVNGMVPSRLPCQTIPQILSPSRTQKITIL